MTILMRGRKKGCGFGWVGKWEGPGRSWESYNQNILYEKKNYFKLIFFQKIFLIIFLKIQLQRILGDVPKGENGLLWGVVPCS